MQQRDRDQANELLEAIRAAPDDDKPRLVYADWLQDRGDPLGEFISVQVHLARIEATDEDLARAGKLKARERALRKAHGEAWLAPLRACFLDHAYVKFEDVVELRRGFVEVLAMPAMFLDEAARRAAPFVRALHQVPTGTKAPWRDVVSHPAAAALDELVLDYAFDDELAAVAGSPHLGGLRRFGLRRAHAKDTKLAGRLPHPYAELEIDTEFGDESVGPLIEALSKRAHPEALRSLRTRGLGYLRGAPAFDALAGLEVLAMTNPGVEPTTALAVARALPRLHTLDLGEDRDAYGCDALDAGELLDALPAIRRLRLSKLGLGDAHAIAIARSPRAARLERLDLSRNAIGAAGARAIANSEHLRNLRRLSLNANRLDDKARAAVKGSPHLANAVIQLR